MRQRSVAFFCMPETGHFRRLRSLISGLTRGGVAAHVYTHRRFRPQVENAGGTFCDLFSEYSLEQADNQSLPVPCRFVTFAARYAELIRGDVERVRPSLVIHDGFAVIGRVIAKLLGIPRVNVCAGHNVAPERFLETLRNDPRVRISPECLRAVDVLRESYGMTAASPFSYVSSLSPYLNIYCEPPQFLEEEERRAFEPVVFYGSLPALEDEEYDDSEPNDREGRSSFGAGPGTMNIYVSFGTVVWRYYAAEALRALTCLASAFAQIDGLRAIISLADAPVGSQTVAALARPNVRSKSWVDQWRVLKGTDAFVTHHGMNSTHEAIFRRVPMISYPFFWDQPALAEKCQKLGLAIPLTDSPKGDLSGGDVHAAIEKLDSSRETMQAALSQAHEWERAVIRDRPTVLQRIQDLIQ